MNMILHFVRGDGSELGVTAILYCGKNINGGDTCKSVLCGFWRA